MTFWQAMQQVVEDGKQAFRRVPGERCVSEAIWLAHSEPGITMSTVNGKPTERIVALRRRGGKPKFLWEWQAKTEDFLASDWEVAPANCSLEELERYGDG